MFSRCVRTFIIFTVWMMIGKLNCIDTALIRNDVGKKNPNKHNKT